MRARLLSAGLNLLYCLTVESVESNGKERTVTHYERLASAYRHDQLIDHLNDAHNELLDEKPPAR